MDAVIFTPLNGDSLRLSELPSVQGQAPIIVVISPDCDACDAYIKEMSSCQPAVSARLRWVSVGEPQALMQSRMGQRLQRENQNVYFAKNPKLFRTFFKATPATLTKGLLLYGVQSCSYLGGLLK